ncbi:GNAT family N-acetyltransferase [Mycolicibacterium fluoranthenivorans]|uniref:Ribosomal protein S18 acetylase RimI-like enzyme n=1 Tax=Mycolicibacterium fluoranthenivorans TaxID=258505 RepID=A0A7X5U2F4_9MYCO|nr:GNAT family N-acetyltransferase [Mycolicibacterium fluoranthenivorans]NIH97131.1 ribosomal protein S18 acetylase RimI-like enzyme [Mycolicibacterium fluoranthenivorans]
MTTVDVRPAVRADIAALSQVLGRAFYDDPVMAWMLPDPVARRRKLHRVFAALTRHHHLSRGGVEVAAAGSVLGAAALWDPPGQWRHTVGEQVRAAPGLLLAFGAALRRGQQAEELMQRHHPEEPHWYLAVIGSDPSVRGSGQGQALMRSRLDRCDAEHAPAYLESSNPANIGYYQRFGFEVTGEIVLPDGPSLWPMWRQPR